MPIRFFIATLLLSLLLIGKWVYPSAYIYWQWSETLEQQPISSDKLFTLDLSNDDSIATLPINDSRLRYARERLTSNVGQTFESKRIETWELIKHKDHVFLLVVPTQDLIPIDRNALLVIRTNVSDVQLAWLTETIPHRYEIPVLMVIGNARVTPFIAHVFLWALLILITMIAWGANTRENVLFHSSASALVLLVVYTLLWNLF
jgi:hypothetical protein